ncbi:hypothetical protein ABZ650_26480, partial [Streptomyces griseoviridis]|uniref:hypothetical protein n=1 Tax=Streptomyces griseoviridis TaxID=45398 RepID=UPI0033C62ED6
MSPRLSGQSVGIFGVSVGRNLMDGADGSGGGDMPTARRRWCASGGEALLDSHLPMLDLTEQLAHDYKAMGSSDPR